MNECPMTLFGKQQIEDELLHLIRVEREQIKQAIAEARDLGDLKENAEYHAAKEKQSHLEGRIADLQGKLARARVVDTTSLKTDKIVFGATVKIFDHQKDQSLKLKIVGEDEAIHDAAKISYNSPLGKALIGKEAGDEIVVKAPKGEMKYEVEDIEYI
jgi:transcription elongation factor GreA